MTIIPTDERVAGEFLNNRLTTAEKLALYGVAQIVIKKVDETVPLVPVEGAIWPVRDEQSFEASA